MSTVIPAIGMGATHRLGSDEYSYTITRISPSGKRIWLKRDQVKVVSGSELDGTAVYEITPNPDSSEIEVSLRSNGRWYQKGQDMVHWSVFYLGSRSFYRDPSI